MGKLRIKYHPEARREADAAFDWYRDRSLIAAERFYSALDVALDSIQDSPEAWAEYLYGTRRYLLKRYPYVIVYRMSDQRIEIIAVAHTSRRPGYWKSRR